MFHQGEPNFLELFANGASRFRKSIQEQSVKTAQAREIRDVDSVSSVVTRRAAAASQGPPERCLDQMLSISSGMNAPVLEAMSFRTDGSFSVQTPADPPWKWSGVDARGSSFLSMVPRQSVLQFFETRRH